MESGLSGPPRRVGNSGWSPTWPSSRDPGAQHVSGVAGERGAAFLAAFAVAADVGADAEHDVTAAQPA